MQKRVVIMNGSKLFEVLRREGWVIVKTAPAHGAKSGIYPGAWE